MKTFILASTLALTVLSSLASPALARCWTVSDANGNPIQVCNERK